MKMKTKKIVQKRFKITKSGKVLHRAQGRRHLRRKKNKSRQRRQDRIQTIQNTRYKRIIKHFMSA